MAPTDAHPPLGKYIIAAGIQLGIWLNSTAKIAPEVGIAPFNYRQANALIGSLIPLIVIGLAHIVTQPVSQQVSQSVNQQISQQVSRQISQPAQQKSADRRWQFALLSGLFVAIDGLFITESRYALLNVQVVCLGLLSHWLWLKAALTPNMQGHTKVRLRLAAGCFLGGAIAVKWNGLGYLLSLIIWEIWTLFSNSDRSSKQTGPTLRNSPKNSLRNSLRNLAYLILISATTYSLIWWPHLHITQENIFSVHANLFSFHQHLGASGHAACSKWYSWPLLLRPITYEYISIGSQAYTVSNLGNPALWLLSSSAVLLLAVNYTLKTKHALSRTFKLIRNQPQPNRPIGPYLLISYLCNWLPWMLVQRCTFNYLYMPAAVYSFMTLAWLLSMWLNAPVTATKIVAWLMLGLIAIAFVFWLPLTFGLSLSSQGLQMRWLLKSWI